MIKEIGRRAWCGSISCLFDIEVILKIKPSRRHDEDILAWQLEKSGVFSVRSAYKLAFNQDPE
jgi:hypothetical protein